MTSDVAFIIAMSAGWIALVITFAWPTPKCDYSSRCSRCREWVDQDRKEHT